MFIIQKYRFGTVDQLRIDIHGPTVIGMNAPELHFGAVILQIQQTL